MFHNSHRQSFLRCIFLQRLRSGRHRFISHDILPFQILIGALITFFLASEIEAEAPNLDPFPPPPAWGSHGRGINPLVRVLVGSRGNFEPGGINTNFFPDPVTDNGGGLSAGEHFLACQIPLPPIEEPSTFLIRIIYAASDPLDATIPGPGTRYGPGPGTLRIWLRSAHALRNGLPLTLGGDYLPPGVYTAEDLGLSPDDMTWTLYFEMIRSDAENHIHLDWSTDGGTRWCPMERIGDWIGIRVVGEAPVGLLLPPIIGNPIPVCCGPGLCARRLLIQPSPDARHRGRDERAVEQGRRRLPRRCRSTSADRSWVSI